MPTLVRPPAVLAALTLVLPVGLVRADFRPQNVTAGEMARLPAYCEDVQGFKYGDAHHNTSPRARYWVGIMGQTFWALHHYCWALIYVQRHELPGQTAQQRAALMNWAINDMKYVINHATADFVLLPEIFHRMGESYINLKAYSAAGDAFAQARRAKPDYWPPYVRWAEVLASINRKPEAMAHLEEALRLMPGEAAVRNAYRRLGGNPERFVAALPPGQAAPTIPAAPASGPSR